MGEKESSKIEAKAKKDERTIQVNTSCHGCNDHDGCGCGCGFMLWLRLWLRLQVVASCLVTSSLAPFKQEETQERLLIMIKSLMRLIPPVEICDGFLRVHRTCCLFQF